jgi:adenosylmethionine---8-amino-7-oxononanoate aminotransferase
MQPSPPTVPPAGPFGEAALLRARDLAVVWHPCTQMKDHEAELPLVPIRRGRGVWLEGFDGQHYLDAISSWWVNLFGHCHPAISAAITRQAGELEHVIFAGFTHEPGIELAERLIGLTPHGLSRCFFADNGSAAVEVALKMSFHYWQNAGRPQKRRFVTLANSYHGETLGALAVGDVDLYKATYGPLLMPVTVVPSPDAYAAQPGESPADVARRQFKAVETLLEQEGDSIAAVLVEPLVQCAGSMRMYDPLYLKLLSECCRRHQVHLIADEIAVGFGRTGTLFACEQAAITPDFLCLSKGLTGGYLPLAIVLTNDAVYQAFYDDYRRLTAFLHSHSYTGNPLACAAALATLDLFANEPVLERNAELSRHLARRLAPLRDHPQVSDVRQTGLIAAVEMVQHKGSRTPYDWRERRGLVVYRHALSRGVLLRPLGNVVYFMPPYVISEAEIDLMVEVAGEGIDLATRD